MRGRSALNIVAACGCGGRGGCRCYNLALVIYVLIRLEIVVIGVS